MHLPLGTSLAGSIQSTQTAHKMTAVLLPSILNLSSATFIVRPLLITLWICSSAVFTGHPSCSHVS